MLSVQHSIAEKYIKRICYATLQYFVMLVQQCNITESYCCV
nr:MAG TPA_asm: hypothetical protein [Caudoviricetes sp.]